LPSIHAFRRTPAARSVLESAETGSAIPFARFDFAALFQLDFVREGKRFRRRTLLGRTIAKD
jgi:hypothetical protein